VETQAENAGAKLKAHVKSAALLIGGQGINLVALIALQAVIKRAAGTQLLGQFVLLIGIHTLISLFSESGWGPTVAREIALAQNSREEAELARAVLRLLWKPVAIHAMLGVLAALLLWRLRDPSYLAPGLLIAALSAGFPTSITLRDLLQGKGDMRGLAMVYAGPSALALVLVVVLKIGGAVTLGTSALAYALGLILVVAAGMNRAGALSRTNGRAAIQLTDARARYGKRIWLGRQVAVGGYAVDTPLLGIFATPTAVAHYAIAKAVCNPMGVGFGLAAQPLFRSMAMRSRLPRTWQIATWTGALLGTVCVAIASATIVQVVYGISPRDLRVMLFIQSATAGCIGIYSIYNQFLSATAQGRILQCGGIASGCVSLLANAVLIPAFGPVGACAAALCSCSFWLAFCFYSYLRIAGGSVTGPAADHA
jgi:O-antigen/teichoic acid export membrane protein